MYAEQLKHLFQLVELCSDLGGSFGFWMGLSILTLFEVVELVWDLAMVCFTSKRRHRDNAVSAVDVKKEPQDGMN